MYAECSGEVSDFADAVIIDKEEFDLAAGFLSNEHI
jgi:hypothetical protein